MFQNHWGECKKPGGFWKNRGICLFSRPGIWNIPRDLCKTPRFCIISASFCGFPRSLCIIPKMEWFFDGFKTSFRNTNMFKLYPPYHFETHPDRFSQRTGLSIPENRPNPLVCWNGTNKPNDEWLIEWSLMVCVWFQKTFGMMKISATWPAT